jgi:hypothetical protein
MFYDTKQGSWETTFRDCEAISIAEGRVLIEKIVVFVCETNRPVLLPGPDDCISSVFVCVYVYVVCVFVVVFMCCVIQIREEKIYTFMLGKTQFSFERANCM